MQVTLRTLPEHANTDDADHRCIMCPAKAKEQGAKAIMLGCLLHINGDTVAAAFDTLSEVSVVDEHLYVTVCQYFYVIVSIYILNPDDICTIVLYDVWLDTHQVSE